MRQFISIFLIAFWNLLSGVIGAIAAVLTGLIEEPGLVNKKPDLLWLRDGERVHPASITKSMKAVVRKKWTFFLRLYKFLYAKDDRLNDYSYYLRSLRVFPSFP